uniref:protein-serine/threonine phosphatase n=1 Tax=Nicotiana sylvestris TaxID=4096 RepID=A0A1U7X777_NICSY|nr:PREDICTED: RNA polymerase II C-terminal domain phosphatase-like 4 [Nicotiana sylvestris]
MSLFAGASLALDICSHPGVIGGMCIRCGQKVENESGVALGYIHKNLRLADDEIARLGDKDLKNLLRHKKLYLVLDLDHTLLNSARLADISAEELYLKDQREVLPEQETGLLILKSSKEYLTRDTPESKWSRNLQEQQIVSFHYSKLAFSTSTATPAFSPPPSKVPHSPNHQRNSFILRGGNMILLENCLPLQYHQGSGQHFLDPQQHRDPFDASGCSLLEQSLLNGSRYLQGQEGVDKWPQLCHHVYPIQFEKVASQSICTSQFGLKCKSLSETKSDENEAEGALASVLKVLQQIHSLFFDPVCFLLFLPSIVEVFFPRNTDNIMKRDVRQVLKQVRKEILKGCKIVFTQVFPTQFQAENHHLWKLAEQLGATCSTKVDQSVTHVVSKMD